MVRVLHELASLDGGGVAKLLLDYYKAIDNKEDLKFDFLIYDFYENGIYEDELRKMGCSIYKIPALKKDRKASLKEMQDVIAKGSYDVVHSHRCTRGIFALWFAKKYGVKRRIIHSHIAYEDIGLKDKVINKVLSFVNRYLATDLFACGKDAAIYMWGKATTNQDKVHIMRNAIDTNAFRYNPDLRDAKRKEMGVGKEYTIGLVGRLNRQKNQMFLLEIFADVVKKNKNIILLLIGRGEDEFKLKDYASQLGISNNVKFLGIRNDVSEILNALDLFVMPSLYEGLPVSVVEAQANGLDVLTSDKVTEEVAITDIIEYLPLDKNIWVNKILEKAEETIKYERSDYAHRVAEAGYDMVIESKRMQEYYINGTWQSR